MFFGATPFGSAAFSSEFIQNSRAIVTGQELDIAIGNALVVLPINVTGERINLATGEVFVISWNGIVPGATQIWTPIDPDNP